ncbi:MAG: hypothetical protein HY023_07795 [Chloroflexi bacterium]|nr:hypothetical protein [Chloroflexota bacterium]
MTLRRHAAWLIAVAVVLSACGSAATPLQPLAPSATQAPAATQLSFTPAPTQESIPTPLAFATAAPAITEERFVEIEWPPAIRVGDSDFIRLSLVPDAEGSLTPTAETAGHQTQGEPITIPNLYDTHNVLAVAELSGVGFEIDRPGEISQTLLPAERVQWQWIIAPKTAGSHTLTLALKLQFVPKAGGPTSERSVWARLLKVEGRTVLGLSGRMADLLGVVGTISGGLLGFPFADRVYAWLWRRLFPKRMTAS